LFEIGREHVELRLPELPVVRDPRERVAHGRGVERCTPHASFLLDGGEPGTLQHAHVLGDGRERHREAGRELADGVVAGGKARENVAARGVGEGGEGVVERPRMVNHMV
jgi:hypothetical protein